MLIETQNNEQPYVSTSPATDAWLLADPTRSMKIGITGLKHSASLSEETHAYTATVTVDGVRAFSASNHGTGGADMYRRIKGYTGPSDIEIDAWLKVNTPKQKSHDYELDNCLEFIVSDLINDELTRKALKRMLTGKILVIEKDNGQDALFTYKGKPTPENLEKMRRAIAAGQVKGRLVNEADEATMAEARKLI